MYRLLTYCLAVSCLLLQGCKRAQPINWEVSLNHESKTPYGTFLSFKSLKNFFPGVEIKTLSTGFRYDNIDARMMYHDGTALMILNGLSFYISDEELEQLMEFAKVGNEILLFGSAFDDKLEKRLSCYKPYYSLTEDNEEMPLTDAYTGKENLNCIAFASDTNTKYGYQGRTLQGYFQPDTSTVTFSVKDVITSQEEKAAMHEEMKDAGYDTVETEVESEAEQRLLDNAKKDEEATPEEETLEQQTEQEETANSDTAVVEYDDEQDDDYEEEETSVVKLAPEVLGVVNGHPNIVRYSIGEGHITLHAAPLVMSNYFLLQDNNLEYLQGLWNLFPEGISHIYWNDYFKHHPEHSDFGILWKHPATRWALTLSIIALLLYVLLEVKRRQRAMAIVTPLENTSVTFVETVGRLYYNKGNHLNLAEKMTQHFLEWVRSHYYLNTNLLDDTFTRHLAAKSGLPEEVAKNLVEMIHEIRLRSANVDEPYLYHLDNTIQRFYKNKNA